MPYAVEIAPAAEREFRRLPRTVQMRLAPLIDALATNPRPRGVKKLSGMENRYRIRQGDYRVIFEVYDNDSVVVILRIAQRSSAY